MFNNMQFLPQENKKQTVTEQLTWSPSNHYPVKDCAGSSTLLIIFLFYLWVNVYGQKIQNFLRSLIIFVHFLLCHLSQPKKVIFTAHTRAIKPRYQKWKPQLCIKSYTQILYVYMKRAEINSAIISQNEMFNLLLFHLFVDSHSPRHKALWKDSSDFILCLEGCLSPIFGAGILSLFWTFTPFRNSASPFELSLPLLMLVLIDVFALHWNEMKMHLMKRA